MTNLPITKSRRWPGVARFHANIKGVAVCVKCLEPHHKATALAPWSLTPRCRNRACAGILVYPDNVKGTAR